MNDIRFNLDRFRHLIDTHGGVSVVAKEINLDKSLVNRHYNGDKNRPLTATYIGTYCNYFHVSPDYLFGLSDIKTINMDIRDIHKITGLSVGAISSLMVDYMVENEETPKIKLLNFLSRQNINEVLKSVKLAHEYSNSNAVGFFCTSDDDSDIEINIGSIYKTHVESSLWNLVDTYFQERTDNGND